MQILQNRLEEFKSQGLQRTLAMPKGVDFSSNDYLGFANDLELKKRFYNCLQGVPVGATGSRLLRGNLELYEQTEKILAKFVQREHALLFSSGYLANVGVFSSLLQASDIVFSDEFNHASLIDGIRLSKAKKIIFPHLNYDFLERALKKQQRCQGLKVIVTESLFSMEGTLADLHKLAELAAQFNALLIVDEAHSTGIWGSSLVAKLGLTQKVFATIHTAGKALGASGAWVSGDGLIRDYLIQFARTILFSTAPIPALPILLQEAIKFYADVGEARASKVREHSQKLRMKLRSNGAVDSPIIPIIIGDSKNAVVISQWLQNKGWDIKAIRPPTVPIGTARLRVTVKWENTEQQLEKLAADIFSISNS